MSTFSSFSFGCRVNQAEIEALNAVLLGRGWQCDPEHPDVYILNTCAVTRKAEREARQHINQIHEKMPHAQIIVTGCAATNWIKQKSNIAHVSRLIDNKEKSFVADILDKDYKNFSNPQKINAPKPTSNDIFIRSGRVFVKIQDGCQRFCSFCIVPYLRGLPRSVPEQSLIEEIKTHEQAGIREAVLTAINTEAYGYDNGSSLTTLLERVILETAIPRISFGSIHPWSLNENFFTWYKSYASSPRLVDFFHIPLQSGSNKMLTLMKRGYTREDLLEKLKHIVALQPMAFIGTDIIVGYLDETDDDFEDTFTFLEQSPIVRFHVFRFSPREHTAAFYLKQRLSMPSSDISRARSSRLRALSNKKFQAFLDRHVGMTQQALILERRMHGLQSALLENQVPIQVETTSDLSGTILPVEIREGENGGLIGKPL